MADCCNDNAQNSVHHRCNKTRNNFELNTLMIKQRSKATFIFLLLAAFMAFKWAPSHAHLNVRHDHGNEQHQHSFEAHAHQLVVFHADTIDSHHPQMDEAKVVDLDHDHSTRNDKKLDNPSTALTAFVYCPPLAPARKIDPSKGHNPLSRLLHQYPGQPRAPPQFS